MCGDVIPFPCTTAVVQQPKVTKLLGDDALFILHFMTGHGFLSKSYMVCFAWLPNDL
ncbi:hypothetical protein DPMN_172720 [Dreissena polymorpha]|uniref:Uncharacterized protein n=1 Tax=Dreissena polymorpha TaxID=45954 RepID=A0A9D4E244_DREPO|nr:hypothetical protein DPMN_172720 [Dreissena polymorpha]